PLGNVSASKEQKAQSQETPQETLQQSSSTATVTPASARSIPREVTDQSDSAINTGVPAAISDTQETGKPADQRSAVFAYTQPISEVLSLDRPNVIPGQVTIIGLFALGLSQFRVTWLGLEMSRPSGNNQQHAFLLVSMFFILSLTILLIFEWFKPTHISDLEQSSSGSSRVWRIVLITAVFVCSLGILLLTWNRPKITNQCRNYLEASLFPLAISMVIGLVIFYVYQGIKFELDRKGRLASVNFRNVGRRQFLCGIIVTTGAFVIRGTPSVKNASKKKSSGRTGHPRFLKKRWRKKGKGIP